MTAFDLIVTVRPEDTRWSADEADLAGWDGNQGGLSDSDGNDLEVGMLVKMAGKSDWYEIVGVRMSTRRLDLEATDGTLLDAMASEVTVY